MSNLCLHRGATVIDMEALRDIETPDPTATWTPVPHHRVANAVRTALLDSGATIESEEHAVYKDGARYFGLLNLAGTNELSTVVGIRNSHDKTFPAGLSLGSNIFVCDNLAFSGDVVVARKHTRFINNDLDRLVYQAVGKLAAMRHAQETRFDAYRQRELTDIETHDLIIRALDAKVICGESVPKVVHEWREPRHPEFSPRNAWSLFNGFTEVMKSVAPAALVKRTMTLQGLLDNHCGVAI